MEVLIENDFDTANTFVHWKYKAIATFCSERASANINRGGVTYGARKVKCIQGFTWWCTDRRLRGNTLDLDLYDESELEDSIEESELYYEESEKKDEAENHLSSRMTNGFSGENLASRILLQLRILEELPLHILSENMGLPDEDDLDSRDQEMIYHASLEGVMFNRDPKRVLTILKELMIGTNAETWMKVIKCGRLAMIVLQTHYDGTSKGDRRKQVARSDLDKLFYRNKTTFSFENT